ncbi:hypothetical protein RO3G_12897 [Rhizopus delemar RA 99-880]|uniref:Uncharacterized protein n=1 Tax=Rhizopus delemar (strain RA 99-880 / ATCC MYA-4621 / FGSC 9543 / NRRL 43880) TaxID=246409 RepID=I1CIA6_RHIO9|nr:hypothetical protein RO3G_12897 [Rhizopus delemar RA 99-880]|eukprot:EIE88186.1 hypothetical protein RO3G_12897 [Rhizopus delemar RA 99-880]
MGIQNHKVGIGTLLYSRSDDFGVLADSNTARLAKKKMTLTKRQTVTQTTMSCVSSIGQFDQK